MAPRKRKVWFEEDVKDAVAAVVEAKKESGTGRVTRSSTRLLNGESVTDPAAVVEKKGKAAVKEKVAKKAKGAEKEELEREDGDGKGMKTIVIEHCKQCNAFKTRAFQVKEGLESAIDGIQVLVNPEKPRRGCFEIREKDGETFISLLDMKRPFPPLKALNMEKVISDIIEKVK
ncbi:unnamed protein product [Rhodiola kirilowii]